MTWSITMAVKYFGLRVGIVLYETNFVVHIYATGFGTRLALAVIVVKNFVENDTAIKNCRVGSIINVVEFSYLSNLTFFDNVLLIELIAMSLI